MELMEEKEPPLPLKTRGDRAERSPLPPFNLRCLSLRVSSLDSLVSTFELS